MWELFFSLLLEPFYFILSSVKFAVYMIKTIFRFFLLSFFFIFLSCNNNKPVDFGPGEFSCDVCHMQIVDMRFKAEALTKKGKVYHFDSIECLVKWQNTNKNLSIGSSWVTPFFSPEKWIALNKAYLLQSSALPSPMGGNLSAYSSQEELEKALKTFGGKEISVKEVP